MPSSLPWATHGTPSSPPVMPRVRWEDQKKAQRKARLLADLQIDDDDDDDDGDGPALPTDVSDSAGAPTSEFQTFVNDLKRAEAEGQATKATKASEPEERSKGAKGAGGGRAKDSDDDIDAILAEIEGTSPAKAKAKGEGRPASARKAKGKK